MDNQSNKLVFLLVGIASIFVVMFGVRETASIINPILLATVITIVALPIPGSLTRRGVPGWLAMVLTILAVVLLLGLVIMTTIFSVTKLTTALPQYMADAATTAANELPPEVTGSDTPVTTTQYIVQFGPIIQAALASVLGVVTQFGIALFIFFFMISAAMALPGAVRLGLDPQAPVISRITQLTEDVRHYLTILTGINFLVGAGNTVFLMILGVDFAFLWGLLAWFMGYIPSIGFIIALIPPLILAYAQYGLQTAIWVLIGYVLINGGVQNFIQPRIMGQGLKINPVVVFVGLFVWGYLLGGIGALLAVPLTLLVLTVMENFESTRMAAILMRFTGGEKEKEQQEAVKHVQSLWEKTKATFAPQQEPKEGPQVKAKTKK
jgi:AI-2 transport protein TqsA